MCDSFPMPTAQKQMLLSQHSPLRLSRGMIFSTLAVEPPPKPVVADKAG